MKSPKIIRLLLMLSESEKSYVLQELNNYKKGIEVSYLRKLLHKSSYPESTLAQYETTLLEKYSHSTIRWIRSKAYKLLIKIISKLVLDRDIREDIEATNAWLHLGMRQGSSEALPKLKYDHNWTNIIFWLYREPDLRLRHAYYDVLFCDCFTQEALKSLLTDIVLYLWNIRLFKLRVDLNPLFEPTRLDKYKQILNEYLSALEFVSRLVPNGNIPSAIITHFSLNFLKILNRLGAYYIIDKFVTLYDSLCDTLIKLVYKSSLQYSGILFALSDCLNYISIGFKRPFNLTNININHWSSYIQEGLKIIKEVPELTPYYNSLISHSFRWAVWHNNSKLAFQLSNMLPLNNKYNQLELSNSIAKIWHFIINNPQVSDDYILKTILHLEEFKRYNDDFYLVVELTKLIMSFEFPKISSHPFTIGNKIYTWCLRKNYFKDLCSLIRKISYMYTNDSNRWRKLLNELKILYKNHPIYLRLEQIVPLYNWLETKCQNLPINKIFASHDPIFTHSELNYTPNLIDSGTLDLLFNSISNVHKELHNLIKISN